MFELIIKLSVSCVNYPYYADFWANWSKDIVFFKNLNADPASRKQNIVIGSLFISKISCDKFSR